MTSTCISLCHLLCLPLCYPHLLSPAASSFTLSPSPSPVSVSGLCLSVCLQAPVLGCRKSLRCKPFSFFLSVILALCQIVRNKKCIKNNTTAAVASGYQRQPAEGKREGTPVSCKEKLIREIDKTINF